LIGRLSIPDKTNRLSQDDNSFSLTAIRKPDSGKRFPQTGNVVPPADGQSSASDNPFPDSGNPIPSNDTRTPGSVRANSLFLAELAVKSSAETLTAQTRKLAEATEFMGEQSNSI
jgi:hypothetical protein